jgi:uncharacterized protein (TIGR03437 family)
MRLGARISRRFPMVISHIAKLTTALCYGGFLAVAQQPPPPPHHDPELALRRSRWEFDQRASPLGFIPEALRLKALKQLDQMQSVEKMRRGERASAVPAIVSSTQWTLIGPQPIGGVSSRSGIVDALAVDPRNPTVVYLGGEGGVWKTADGGTSWAPLTDTQPALSIGSIALDPSNPDTVYAGTGGVFATYAAGLLKSIDAGANWRQLPGPFAGPFGPDSFFGGSSRILSLAVHPAMGQILLAAMWRWPQSNAGIFRSTDGGTTWKQMLAGPGLQVSFDPANGNIAYAVIGGYYGDPGSGIYKSVDGGITWALTNGTGPNLLPASGAITNITMAVAPSNSLIVYVQVNTAAGPSMFKTTDGGKNWAAITSFSASSCCTRMIVHPSNPNIVFTGGVGLSRSLDGGATWSDVTGGLHVDMRSFAFSTDGSVLYVGNDGGAYSTPSVTDATVTWTSLNASLATVIFYAGHSIHPTDINVTLGGTQDNGTLRYSGDLTWSQVTCGDGSWTAIDPIIPSTVYATCQNISILKSTSGGDVGSWQFAQNGINVNDRSSFVPPIVIDPSNPSTLYFGTYRVYQTIDEANSWTPISNDLTGSSYHYLTTIAVAPSDPNTLYAASDDSHVQVTANAGAAAAANWSDHSSGLPQRFITQLAVDSKNALIVYVTFSGYSGFFGDNQGHVFRSSNGGAGWVDISGNLPNIPVNDIVVDPDLMNTYYVATDIGVFRTVDAGLTWAPLGSGLPRVVISGLKLHRSSRVLRVATHGRSMWDLAVPLSTPNPVPSVTSVSPNTATVGSTGIHLKVLGSGFTGQSLVQWNSTSLATNFVSSGEVDVILADSYVSTAGVYPVTVVNPQPGGGTSSTANFSVTPNLTSAGVTNAASFSSGISPGALATVFGHGLTMGVQGIVGVNSTPWPIQLRGTSVTVNGVSAPLYALANVNGLEQINLQVPVEVAGNSTAPLTVSNNGVSATVQVQVLAAQPAVYADGNGNGIVTHAATAQLVTASSPAIPGEYVTIYANALGPLDVQPATNAPARVSPLSQTIQTPTVTIGSVAAKVTFSGLTPDSIGLYQINVRVPDGITPGSAVPLVVTAGGLSSKPVTIAVAAK